MTFAKVKKSYLLSKCETAFNLSFEGMNFDEGQRRHKLLFQISLRGTFKVYTNDVKCTSYLSFN